MHILLTNWLKSKLHENNKRSFVANAEQIMDDYGLSMLLQRPHIVCSTLIMRKSSHMRKLMMNAASIIHTNKGEAYEVWRTSTVTQIWRFTRRWHNMLLQNKDIYFKKQKEGWTLDSHHNIRLLILISHKDFSSYQGHHFWHYGNFVWALYKKTRLK